jgi:hypothetical protein
MTTELLNQIEWSTFIAELQALFPEPVVKPVWPKHRPNTLMHDIVLDGVVRDFTFSQIHEETCGLATQAMVDYYRSGFYKVMCAAWERNSAGIDI